MNMSLTFFLNVLLVVKSQFDVYKTKTHTQFCLWIWVLNTPQKVDIKTV